MPTAARTPVDAARVPVRPAFGLAWCGVLALALMAAPPAGAQVTATADYLARMDADGDGRISLQEYLDWMMYGFTRMDRNGDGVLEADELPGGQGRAVTRAEYQARLTDRFNRQDRNGDGFLDARELAAPPH